MREHVVPGPAAAWPRALRVAIGAMNIEGLGESLIAQLIERRLVSDYADVYALTSGTLASLTSTSVRADGKAIERRFGEKNAAKVVAQIERSRTNELWRLIYGLGIRHVGERAAQVLADAFGSMDALSAATAEQLQQTREIGPVLAAVGTHLVRRAAQPAADRAARRGRCAHGNPGRHARHPSERRAARRARPMS